MRLAGPSLLSLGGVRAASPGDFGTLVTGWHPEDAVLSGASVTSWPSRWGSSYTLSVADAPQYSVTGWAGTAPAILCDGSNDGLYSDSLGDVFAGSDVPWYCVMAVDVVSLTLNDILIALGDAASATTPRHHLQLTAISPSRWTMTRADDSSATSTVNSATGVVATGRMIMSAEFGGTNWTLRHDGVAVSGMDGATQNVGACGFESFGLAEFRRGGANSFFGNFRFGPVLLYSALSDEAGARAYLHSLGYAP